MLVSGWTRIQTLVSNIGANVLLKIFSYVDLGVISQKIQDTGRNLKEELGGYQRKSSLGSQQPNSVKGTVIHTVPTEVDMPSRSSHSLGRQPTGNPKSSVPLMGNCDLWLCLFRDLLFLLAALYCFAKNPKKKYLCSFSFVSSSGLCNQTWIQILIPSLFVWPLASYNNLLESKFSHLWSEANVNLSIVLRIIGAKMWIT